MAAKSIREKYDLPESIDVRIEKTSSGFIAKVKGCPGLITYSKTFPGMIEDLNDALLTYFEVTRKEAKEVNFMYVPKALIPKKAAKHRKRTVKLKHTREFIRVTPNYCYA